jgi:hypothetical protein
MNFTATAPAQRNMISLLIILSTLLYSFSCPAQPAAPSDQMRASPLQDTTAKKLVQPEKKIQVSGMMILRYAWSPDKRIDVNGQHHTATNGYSTDAFAVRRMRIGAKAPLGPRAEAAVLLNATDFVGSPQNKVLENAFLKYHFNDYLNVQVGQYRPYFGKEDLFPEEQLETLEWSNQYYAFGTNGWQSFQQGATLSGKVRVGKVPLSYYIGVFNGNGRNQAMDNNNGKLFPARMEAALRPQTKLALNGGVGREGGVRTWALGADLDHRVQLSDRLALHLLAEYKTGFNSSLYISDTAHAKITRDYRISGLYALPCLFYSINKGGVQSAGVSMRWETLDASNCSDNNRRNTCMPMLCLQCIEPCSLRLELGAIINDFDYNVPNTSSYSGTRYVCQVKAAF